MGYGSLMRGFWNHGYLKGATFIGYATTAHKYTMFVSGIPYADASHYPPVSHIKGEVYAVNPKQLASLDRLEGHPNFYHREPTRLEFDNTRDQVGTRRSRACRKLQLEAE